MKTNTNEEIIENWIKKNKGMTLSKYNCDELRIEFKKALAMKDEKRFGENCKFKRFSSTL